MTLIKKDNSIDGFEMRIYDYGVKEGKRKLFLWLISNGISEKWNIFAPDATDYKKIADEIIDCMKFQGVRKTLKTVGKRTSITSLKIKDHVFEAERIGVDFSPK